MIAHTQTIFVNDPRGLPGNCLQVAVASLLDLPMEAVPHFALFGDKWFYSLTTWLAEQGLSLDQRMEPIEYCLAFGMSPRGVHHAVVWGPDGLVHDPHPSRDGLSPERWWAIVTAAAAS